MKASAGSPSRVLIVVQNLPVPFDRRVWMEATTLTAAGHAVSVICPTGKGYDKPFEIIEGVEIYRYRIPFEARGTLGYMGEFLWCFLQTAVKAGVIGVRGRGFDVMQVCNPPETFWPLAYLVRPLGKRFVFDHHDLSPELFAVKFGDRPVLQRALRFLERRTFRASDLVLTTNESHKEVAKIRGGVPEADIYVVRSGPDTDRLTVYEPDPQWRHGKDFLLAYLGEICEQDGVEHLVRAVRQLRDTFGRTDFHCVLIGGGPHQPVMREYARELGVEELCTFTGAVSDDQLCRVLSSADVGVDPGPKNEWSDKSTMNKIIEYLFFGLPVVAYDLKETRVSAGDAALYATPNDELDLARHINELLEDSERRAEMRRIARKRFEDSLAWQYSAPILLSAYARLSCVSRPGSWSGRLRASFEGLGSRQARGRRTSQPAM
jgi:glycosyltransferase involved in cell wall biosynthesis